jgi:hypothetical protein
MISLEDCKHGYTYRISSRNLIYGVFNKPVNGFVGIREKMGSEYLFTEFHYDTGAPFGTVNPLEELEECPVRNLSEHFLLTKDKQPTVQVRRYPGEPYYDAYKQRFPDATAKYIYEDMRFDGTQLPESERGSFWQNKVLFNYLKDIEQRYGAYDIDMWHPIKENE